jgi:sigma-B regulation protein RsbQ
MGVIEKYNVKVSGAPDGQPIVFAHGYGCDQNMWRFVVPAFEDRYKVVLFDYVGAGRSDAGSYDPVRYSSLGSYAEDVLEICGSLELDNVVLVGHSVSSMIGALAVNKQPEIFDKLVMVCPSPRYINDGDYTGGFGEADILELLESLESNYLGWSSAMAPVIMGNPDRPELGRELEASFCRTDPKIARDFARITFMADNRADLEQVKVPALVLQCRSDAIAPIEVGEYVRDSLPQSSYVLLDATGHCPHLSMPKETAEAISAFVDG